MSKRLYLLPSVDPYQNLAIENFLLRNLHKGDEIILLWKSKPSVVVGRFQNPWFECDLPLMQRDGIELVRRQSGGGAVYHDLGNLNFSYLASSKAFRADLFSETIATLFQTLHLPLEIGKGNSLYSSKQKFSGSAFKETKDAKLHHATLLIESDLKALKRYLTPSRNPMMESKATHSLDAAVVNLTSLHRAFSPSLMLDLLQKEFTLDTLDQNILDVPYQHLKEASYLFGDCPKFRISEEGIDLHANKGVIVNLYFDGRLDERFSGLRLYEAEDLNKMALLLEEGHYKNCHEFRKIMKTIF